MSNQIKSNRNSFSLSHRGVAAAVGIPLAAAVVGFLGFHHELDDSAINTAMPCAEQETANNPTVSIEDVGSWISTITLGVNTASTEDSPEAKPLMRLADDILDRNQGITDAQLSVSKPQNAEAFVCVAPDGVYRLVEEGFLLQNLASQVQNI